MNSKECLEKLYDACDKDLLYEQYGLLDAYELFEIIKQDLDRLEKLEKENEQLNQTIQTIRQNNKKEFDHLLDKYYELGDENAKFKKVIEIIKEKKVDIPKLLANDFNNYNALAVFFGFKQLTQEEYELLKELLGNRWYNKPLPAFAPEENYDYSFVNDCLQKAEKYDCEGLEKENQELKNTILSIGVDTCIPELRKENTKLKKAIKVFADYILVCKPIDFNIYLHSLCDDTKIQLITELLEEVLSNE